jgi:hypothetical protein
MKTQKSHPHYLEELCYFSDNNLLQKNFTSSASNKALQLYEMGLAVKQGPVTNLYSSTHPQEHLKEAERMEQTLKNYLNSEKGQSFVEYVSKRGKTFMEIKGVGAGDLGENTVAALLHNGLEGIILSNYEGKSFENRVEEMASKYSLNTEAMTEYVLVHELAHAAGCKSEYETENFVKNYFQERAEHYSSAASQSEGEEKEHNLEMAQHYTKLSEVAEERAQEADESGK